MTLNEVAPPGFGHTKGDKKKGVEKGGTAAAFDRARKEGRFKGSKSDMFAIMWSQKNKGDKPHYKPGTDKKYKKYQEESAVLDANTKIKKNEKREKDKKELVKLIQRYRHMKDMENPAKALSGRSQKESFEIDKSAHKKVQKQKKMRNLSIKNPNKNEADVAHKKAGGPKLMGEGKRWDSYKKAVATVLGKKKEEKKPEKAMDAGARAKRKLQRKVHATYVSGSEDNVPDEIRD